MSEPSNDKRPEELQREIETIRDNIGGLVSELDHRRHDFLNVGARVRRHGALLALSGLALVGMATGAVLLARRRARARERLPGRAVRIGNALARMVKHPERQAPPPPSVGLKILAAAGAAAASFLVRRLLQRLIDERRLPDADSAGA